MVASRAESAAHQPADRFSIMPIHNRKKKMCEELKVILLGNAGVGKTSLHAAMATTTQDAAMGVDFHVRMASLNQHIVKIQLWDTANQEKFGGQVLPKSYFRRARGAFLMYDVSNRRSFRDVLLWASQLQALVDTTEPLAVVLVANASHCRDLCDERVSTEEGHALAEMLQATFVEFSPAHSFCLDTCFHALLTTLADSAPWQVDLSTASTELQAIEARAEMASGSTTESDSDSETEDDCEERVHTYSTIDHGSQTIAAMCSRSSASEKELMPTSHRRGSSFFIGRELGFATATSAGVAGLPTARELMRAALFTGCLLLCLWPFVLLILLQDDSPHGVLERGHSVLLDILERMRWSSSLQ